MFGAVLLFEVWNDVVVVVEGDVAVDHDGNARLARDGFDLTALGVRTRNVHILVVEQQIGELLADARTVRTPLGLVEDDIGLATHV